MDLVHRLSWEPRCESDRVNRAALPSSLEQALGHRFQDEILLREALTHASYNEGRNRQNNERLEFLGDRILGLVVAEHLFKNFPEWGENELAPRLNSVVNRDSCANAARSAGIGAWLRLSPAEADQGGQEKASILADASEALVAAIYLDGGLQAARSFIETHWGAALSAVGTAVKDPKMALQELAAAQKLPPPEYIVLARSGPDHAPLFTVAARVSGLGTAEAQAGSKREAERAAAARLIEQAQRS